MYGVRLIIRERRLKIGFSQQSKTITSEAQSIMKGGVMN